MGYFMRKRAGNKYGNVATSGCYYGKTHRSKLEKAVCDQIWFEEQAGLTKHLGHEVQIYLTRSRIRYIADFHVLDVKTGIESYREGKGFESARWPIIKKLWRDYGPADLHIFKGHHLKPYLDETIQGNPNWDKP